MRKYVTIFAIIVLFNFPILAYSQGKTVVRMQEGEITLVFNDGNTQKGKVLKLKQRFLSRIDPLSIENKLGLDAKTIKIVTDDGERLEFPSSDVTKIIVPDGDENKELWNMKLKTLDKKLNLVDAGKNAMLPLTYDDRINIYSYNVYTSGSFQKGGVYAGTIVYLSNDKEDYAIILMDQKGVGFSMKKAKAKFQKAIKQVFKDCPETIAYIDDGYEKASKATAGLYFDAIDIAGKRIKKLPKAERAIAWDDFYTEFFAKGYIELIDHYNEHCPE